MLTYPFERPESRSVMTRTPDSSPKLSNSRVSHSSSMLYERRPTKRFLSVASSPMGSVFVFFAAGSASASALRFLGAGTTVSSSSSSLSSSDDDSDEPDEVLSLPDSSSEEACDDQ